jgi:hypothetical protein
MHPPADVGHRQAAVAQPSVFLGLAQLHDPHQPIGPADQLLGMAAPSATTAVQRLRGADEAILGALGCGSLS